MVAVEESQVTFPMAAAPYSLDEHLKEREKWKARLAYVMISGRFSRFSVQPLWYWISKGPKEGPEISSPPKVRPTPCLFPLHNAHVLSKDSASCLIIVNQPNHQTSALILGKMRFVWGGEGSKERIFQEQSLGTLGRCGGL